MRAVRPLHHNIYCTRIPLPAEGLTRAGRTRGEHGLGVVGQFLGRVKISAWSVGEKGNPGCLRRETGLKPLDGCRRCARPGPLPPAQPGALVAGGCPPALAGVRCALLRGTKGLGFSEASGGIDRQLNQAGELTLSRAIAWTRTEAHLSAKGGERLLNSVFWLLILGAHSLLWIAPL